MTTLKLTAVGTSTGMIIPKEMLSRLNVAKGDVLYAVETPDGGYRLTPYDPDFAAKMDKADEIMKRYRNSLHALAKWPPGSGSTHATRWRCTIARRRNNRRYRLWRLPLGEHPP